MTTRSGSGWLGYVMSPRKDEAAPEATPQEESAPHLLTDLDVATKKASEHAVAQAEERLEQVMIEAFRMLRDELRSEIANETKVLRAQVSELCSSSDLRTFGQQQATLKEQQGIIHAEVGNIAKMVNDLMNTIRPNSNADAADDKVWPESSQLEDKFAVLHQSVCTLQTTLSTETKAFQCQPQSCSEVGTPTMESQQEVTLQCETTTQKTSTLEQDEAISPSATSTPPRSFSAQEQKELPSAGAPSQASNKKTNARLHIAGFEAAKLSQPVQQDIKLKEVAPQELKMKEPTPQELKVKEVLPQTVKVKEAVPAVAMSTAVPPGCMSLDDLRDPWVWKATGVDAASREQLLPDEAFVALFGMDKESFKNVAKWKRDRLKKQHGLF